MKNLSLMFWSDLSVLINLSVWQKSALLAGTWKACCRQKCSEFTFWSETGDCIQSLVFKKGNMLNIRFYSVTSNYKFVLSIYWSCSVMFEDSDAHLLICENILGRFKSSVKLSKHKPVLSAVWMKKKRQPIPKLTRPVELYPLIITAMWDVVAAADEDYTLEKW